MKTSYSGCNPEIAESLQRGEHIKCISFDGNTKTEITVCAYDSNVMASYVCTNRQDWDTAEPIKTATYVIDAVAMMKGLVERGYLHIGNGDWALGKKEVLSPVWSQCGEILTGNRRGWEPWMLEQKEVE